MEKIASFDPVVGSTWVSGSTSLPKRRRTYPAIASRRTPSPRVVGYCDTSGTARRRASGMKGAVGSRGSPIEKSISLSPASRICLARPWIAAIG